MFFKLMRVISHWAT